MIDHYSRLLELCVSYARKLTFSAVVSTATNDLIIRTYNPNVPPA
jgi:hypothetical protein